jgi:DNA polymerase-3 subunit beta
MLNIQVSSGELLKLASICANAIPSRAVMVILKDFYCEVKDSKLYMTGSDLEFTVQGMIPVTSNGDGRFSLQAESLIATLRELPEQPIELEYDVDTLSIQIKSSTGHYKSACNNVNDYPELPTFTEDNQLIISSDRLLKALNTCAFATSTDEMKTNMLGINMAILPGCIEFVATNSHKLVKFTVFTDQEDLEKSMILPKKVLSILKSMVNEDLPVTILFTKNQVKFMYKDLEITAKLIDLAYPKYNSVIPVDNDKTVVVDRNILIHTLRRLIVYGNKTTFQTNITVNDNQMVLDTTDIEFSNEAVETIPCQYEGETLELCYNAKYLIESLSNLVTDEVKFLISQSDRAALLLPKENEIGEDILMIVMPVMKWRGLNE